MSLPRTFMCVPIYVVYAHVGAQDMNFELEVSLLELHVYIIYIASSPQEGLGARLYRSSTCTTTTLVTLYSHSCLVLTS